jgi:hypothetical protein
VTNGAAQPVEATAVVEEDSPRPASGRETAVLGAVRSLVRATAAEVAQATGLANGTAVVVLRALVASGQVAKASTARGVEYNPA